MYSLRSYAVAPLLAPSRSLQTAFSQTALPHKTPSKLDELLLEIDHRHHALRQQKNATTTESILATPKPDTSTSYSSQPVELISKPEITSAPQQVVESSPASAPAADVSKGPFAFADFTWLTGDAFKVWDACVTADWMPSQYITWGVEYNHRAANVPYFTGPEGVTPPGGNTGTPGSAVANWSPDLKHSENRATAAILVKF